MFFCEKKSFRHITISLKLIYLTTRFLNTIWALRYVFLNNELDKHISVSPFLLIIQTNGNSLCHDGTNHLKLRNANNFVRNFIKNLSWLVKFSSQQNSGLIVQFKIQPLCPLSCFFGLNGQIAIWP